MQQLTQGDFIRLVEFIKANYGINLTEKKHLIESRLGNTLIQMGFSNFGDYVNNLLNKKDPDDLNFLLNKITTNHTYFMREHEHFDFLQSQVLPWLKSSCPSHAPSIWSAGCSSGEEPYTLSMVMMDYFGKEPARWDTRILATDISDQVLDKARAGRYQKDMMGDVPGVWQQKYFDRKDDAFTVKPFLRQNVDFRKFNLMSPITFKSKFDVIFCRNVMIYFELPVKKALVSRFYDAMKPGAFLFIGHSETLNFTSQPFEYIQPSIYRKR